jgi:uncharacterized protein YodC (DUF2158 family)
MGKYSIKDFKVGDEVYHLSNNDLMMVIKEIHQGINEVTCRWIDKSGKVETVDFMPEELGKRSDTGPRITNLSSHW